MATGTCTGGTTGTPQRQCLHDGTWQQTKFPCQ